MTALFRTDEGWADGPDCPVCEKRGRKCNRWKIEMNETFQTIVSKMCGLCRTEWDKDGNIIETDGRGYDHPDTYSVLGDGCRKTGG